MLAFAQLLDRLVFTGSTITKKKLIADYLRSRPDPERGYALAALTGELSFKSAKPALVRELIMSRVDPVLYTLSRDYVGDMAETIALLWPSSNEPGDISDIPTLSEIVENLNSNDRMKLKAQLSDWLDNLDTTARWALLKLITGNIRIGVSARLAKTALADAFNNEIDNIEQIWHGASPPYSEIFSWLEGHSDKPVSINKANFMPMMLSHAIEEAELRTLDLSHFQIELKWDGIRMQLVRSGENVALYSRTGDEITHTFPDIVKIVKAMECTDFVLDGELLVTTADGVIASFNDLQQRLNRKKPTAALMEQFPAHFRVYDMLMEQGEDIRSSPLSIRRERLKHWLETYQPAAMDLSSLIHKDRFEELDDLRQKSRTDLQHGTEGLMLKRLDSPYIGGRPRGYWFKWKRNTLILDCVLMYAQRGSGKRSSFYSDYTFGVWHENKLVPVGKSYSGFTDEELGQLDKWIRAHTTTSFGPVREVKPELVLEIEFDSIQQSKRHKSGLAMRFPRVHRIRWDKPAAEADHLSEAFKLVKDN